MDFRKTCHEYFELIKKNLPHNVEPISFYLNERAYNGQIPKSKDLVNFYFHFGLDKKTGRKKTSSFSTTWSAILSELRNDKLDKLFD